MEKEDRSKKMKKVVVKGENKTTLGGGSRCALYWPH